MGSGRTSFVPKRLASAARATAIVAALGGCIFASVSPSWGAGAPIYVALDKAKLVKYPANTETIVVGNPIIADVTMLKGSGLLILTGKGFGETNLVFLDRAGAVLSEAGLVVQPSPSLLVVQRGMDRESYACHPRCEPAVSLGDASSFIKGVIGDIGARNGLAAPAAGH